MSIFQKIAESLGFGTGKVRPENVTYSDSVNEAFGLVPSSSGAVVTPVSAMRVAAVFACVQRIAGAIATLPLHIYRTNGDVKERMERDSLWYKLNESPCISWSGASHWENVSINQLLRGDSFTLINRGSNGSVIDLTPLPWSCVYPEMQQDGSIKYFITYPDRSMTMWVTGYDMLHFPGFGFNGLRGMSVISYAARSAVGNAMAMDEYSGKFFANGAHPSIILKAAGRMTADQQTQLQNAFRAKYSGMENAHRVPLVLTEGLDAKEISLSAEDAQLLEARKFQVIDIARAFGVPPHMIGETSASTSWGSGIEAMSRAFVTYTLQPHLVRIEQELNRKLFPRNPNRVIQFDRDALIEGDSKAQADYNRAALGGPGTGQGWMTVNEIRKSKGLAPVADGDVIFDPRQQQNAANDSEIANFANQLREMKHETEVFAAKVSNQSAPVINVAAPVVNVANQMPEQPAPVVQNTVNVPETTINVEAVMPEQVVNVAAPDVKVINEVNPSPVQVTNEVHAPNVLVTNEVKPADVRVELPTRRTDTTITRDAAGNIVKAVQIEKDA